MGLGLSGQRAAVPEAGFSVPPMRCASEQTPKREAAPLGFVLEERCASFSRGDCRQHRIRPECGSVQYGDTPASAKPWKGLGTGVHEIVENDASGTYRAVHTVQFAKAVYVLHALQKKSPSGIRTARSDVELIEQRLWTARADYEERYGKEAR